MGAKQSGPAATNGRTRAYSGSDVPSTTSGGHSRAAAAAALGTRYHHAHHGAHGATSSGASPQHNGASARSVGGGRSSGASATRPQSGITIPNSRAGAHRSHESAGSTPDESAPGERERSNGGQGGPRLLVGSLPAHLSPHLFGGFQCPVCSKYVSTDEMDLHLVMCLTKPRVTYNEDVLNKAAGECAICLEELTQGETIARLPCLCIYHKCCIDEWFDVNRSCPEHPSD